MNNQKHFSIIPLFPTPLLSLLDQSLCESVETLFKSYSGEWTSEDENQNSRTRDINILNSNGKLLFKLTEISKDLIGTALKIGDSIQISTSWFTRVSPGGQGTPHSHTNSWWSGVYYFRDGMSPIRFQQFPVGIHPSKPYESNEFNSLSFLVEPSKGTLLLFPSNVIHCIQKNQNNFDRCTLTFNIMPKGKTGTGDSIFNY